MVVGLVHHLNALLLLLADQMLELLRYLSLALIGEMQALYSLHPAALLGPRLLRRHVSNLDGVLVLRVAVATLRAILLRVAEVVPGTAATRGICRSVVVVPRHLIVVHCCEVVDTLGVDSVRLLGIATWGPSCSIVVREGLGLLVLALGLVHANRQTALVIAKTHSLDGSEDLHILGHSVPRRTITLKRTEITSSEESIWRFSLSVRQSCATERR